MAGVLGLLMGSGLPATAETAARGIRHSLPSHPGNIFVVGEEVSVETNQTIPVFLYNFGTSKAKGRLSLTLPEGWKGELPGEVEVAPGERKELPLNLVCTGSGAWSQANLQVRGNFGAAGWPVLAVRLVPE